MKQFGKWIGSSALMVASIFMLTSLLSCGGNTNKPVQNGEKFEVKFGVEPAGKGKIVAKVDGKDIKSGDKVEKNKEVVFTLSVTDEKKYEYSKWEGEGLTNTTATGAKLKVTKKADIKAVLKEKSNGGGGGGDVTEGKTVTFKVVDDKGADVPAAKASISATKKAKDATSATNLTSGDKVAKDTELVFTLKIDDTTYMLDKWEGATEDSANKLVAKTTMDASDINVVAKIKPNTTTGDGHTVTFKVVDEKGADVPVAKASISATKQAKDATSATNLTSGEKVAKDTELVFTLKIDDTTYMLDKWEGATKDTANELVAKVTMDAADINVVAKLKKNSTDPAKQVTFKVVDENDKDLTTDKLVIKAMKKVGAATEVAFNSGDEVEKDATLTFMLEIKDTSTYEFKEWKNATKDTSDELKATATKGATALEVKVVVKKYARLATLKIVDASQADKVLHEFSNGDMRDAIPATGFTFHMTEPQANQKVRLVATAEPSDAVITFNPEDMGKDAGDDIKAHPNFTITVEKKTADNKDDFIKTTYTFKTILDKEVLKCTEIKLGDHTLQEADIEAAASTNGYSYIFAHDKGAEFAITEKHTPTDATVAIKVNGADCSGKCTPEETEKTITITLTKQNCDTVTYTIKVKKAKATKDKHELKSLKIGEETLSEQELETAKGKLEWVVKKEKVANLKFEWETEGGKVTVAIKKEKDDQFSTAEDKTATKNYTPTVTKEDCPFEVEITVYEKGDGSADDNKTVYTIEVSVED